MREFNPLRFLLKRWIIGLFAASTVSSGSFAMQFIQGKVVLVEPTYLPGWVTLQMDAGLSAGLCPAGANLVWQKTDVENNKAIYAALLTALASGKSIRFYINDNDTTCHGQYLHLLNN